MSENQSFWQRNSGALLFGVAAYLVVTPAFGFNIDHERSEGHGVNTTDESPEPNPIPGPARGPLELVGGTVLVDDTIAAVDAAVDAALAGIELPVETPELPGVDTPAPDAPGGIEAIELPGTQIPLPGPPVPPVDPDAIDLFGEQIPVDAPGSVALVGQMIDVLVGEATQPSDPEDLIIKPGRLLVALINEYYDAVTETEVPVYGIDDPIEMIFVA